MSDDPDDPWVRADALIAEVEAAQESRVAAEVLLEAAEVRQAEWARCRLVDRLRAARNPVRVELAHVHVRGWVEGAGPDVIVLDDGRERWAIALGQVLTVDGLGPALAEERSAPDRLLAIGWAAHARDLIGEQVRLHCTTGSVLSRSVTAVGADHLDAMAVPGLGFGTRAEPTSIPFTALAVMASRSRMGAPIRMPESGRTSA